MSKLKLPNPTPKANPVIAARSSSVEYPRASKEILMNGNEFRIVMLGASGVGKTSTLTAMYDKIGDIDQIIRFQPADPRTRTRLDDGQRELRRLAAAPEVVVGIPGTQDQRTFKFTVTLRNKNESLDFIFQDYPGSYLTDSQKKEEVIGFIKTSNVIIIPIDAIALMFNKGEWNELRNQTKLISQMFEEVYRPPGDKRQSAITQIMGPILVIFPLVKCETYISKPGKNNKYVNERFEKTYTDLLDFFENEMRDRVAVVRVPVHTLGCVKLERIQEQNGEPMYYLRNDAQEEEYNPDGGERLLRYILRFLLTHHQENQSNQPSSGLSKLLNILFVNNNDFVQAVKKFAKEDAEIDEWAVIQGRELLG